MAENQKVFVSPGVYTAEKDLTFVAQSVGVTTLGVAGETKKPLEIDSVIPTLKNLQNHKFLNMKPRLLLGLTYHNQTNYS